MKETRFIMGMHITLEVVDDNVTEKDLTDIFDYFVWVDTVFSPYKKTSEVSRLNDGKKHMSVAMKKILDLAEETRRETDGYFSVYKNGKLDPSGIVKGWAIGEAANLLEKKNFKNFYVDAGGDIQVKGHNSEGKDWSVGIQNPFNIKEIVKVVRLQNKGIATSGTAMRGQHIYNPFNPDGVISDIVSLSVIGPNVYEADRFATAAFAMGKKGIYFIEERFDLEGYMIERNGIATYTSGFHTFVQQVDTQRPNFL